MKEIEGVTPTLTITNILEVVNLAERLALHGLVEYLARKTKHILERDRSALTHKHIETAFQLSGPHMQKIFVDACVMPLMQFLHDERHDGDREESPTEDDGEQRDPARQQFYGPSRSKYQRTMDRIPKFELQLLRAMQKTVSKRQQKSGARTQKYNIYFIDPLTEERFEL